MVEATIAPHIPIAEDHLRGYYRDGRLGQACEGRAKRRIFAIGNAIKQRLLKPVHHWLMQVLKGIPMDGTFHQSAPLYRLLYKNSYDSCDLSAATDRMPLRVFHQVMQSFWGSEFSGACVNSTLALNTLEVGFSTYGFPFPLRNCLSKR